MWGLVVTTVVICLKSFQTSRIYIFIFFAFKILSSFFQWILPWINTILTKNSSVVPKDSQKVQTTKDDGFEELGRVTFSPIFGWWSPLGHELKPETSCQQNAAFYSCHEYRKKGLGIHDKDSKKPDQINKHHFWSSNSWRTYLQNQKRFIEEIEGVTSHDMHLRRAIRQAARKPYYIYLIKRNSEPANMLK